MNYHEITKQIISEQGYHTACYNQPEKGKCCRCNACGTFCMKLPHNVELLASFDELLLILDCKEKNSEDIKLFIQQKMEEIIHGEHNSLKVGDKK